MSEYTNVGIIENTVLEKTYEEAHIEWRISDIFTIPETQDLCICYCSPAFFVNDISWILQLYQASWPNYELMKLSIKSDVKREYSLEYNFGLKKNDGSVQQLTNGILGRNVKSIITVKDSIKRSELLQRKSELAPQDALTVTCILKREIYSQPADKTTPMKLIRLDKLSESFKDLFHGDKETFDVILKVKDEEYKAHMSVLIARSKVFAATFKHDTLERQKGIITITDCDPDSFAVFLEYLYCGKVDEISVCVALNLYYTSNKYDVQELKEFCIEYLMQNLTVENVCEIAVFSDKYDETALLSAVQEFFNQNAGKIFVTSEWVCFLKEDILLANKLLIEMSKVKLDD